MSSNDNFRLYNQFALLARQVLKVKIQVGDLTSNPGETERLISEAMKSGNEELKGYAQALAKQEKLYLGSSSSSGASSQPSSTGASSSTPVRPNQTGPIDWKKIEEAAIKIAGPIGMMLVNKVKATSPANQDEAVSAVAGKLGSKGSAFLREL